MGPSVERSGERWCEWAIRNGIRLAVLLVCLASKVDVAWASHRMVGVDHRHRDGS
jgi:hypothetical protein